MANTTKNLTKWGLLLTVGAASVFGVLHSNLQNDFKEYKTETSAIIEDLEKFKQLTTLDCSAYTIAELYAKVQEVIAINPNAQLKCMIPRSVAPTGGYQNGSNYTPTSFIDTDMPLVYQLTTDPTGFNVDPEIAFQNVYSGTTGFRIHVFRIEETRIRYVEHYMSNMGNTNFDTNNGDYNEIPEGMTIKLIY